MNKKGFTLIEIIIAMLIIGVGLSSIIVALQYATRVTNTSKAQVVAINLAREWVETVFNMRDTNWKMYAGKKDKCWLVNVRDPFSADCQNLGWFWQNNGYTSYITAPLGDLWYMLSGTTVEGGLMIVENGELAMYNPYRLCLPQSSNRWDYCSNINPVENPTSFTQYGRFWREISSKWLFLKDTTVWWTQISCANWVWPDAPCGWSDAQELRFCSKVDYNFDAKRRVELCSVLTNFEK